MNAESEVRLATGGDPSRDSGSNGNAGAALIPSFIPPLGEAPAGVRASTDAERRIDQDLACVRCGYNLRTLTHEQLCPECGLAVATSVEQSLGLLTPAWVKKLVRGLDLIMLGTLLGFVVAVLGSIIGNLLHVRLHDQEEVIAEWVCGMPPGLLIAWGCWMVTTPHPRLPTPNSRNVARFCVFVITVMAFCSLPLALLVALGVAQLLVMLAFVLLVIAAMAALVYGRWVARQIPAPRLARTTNLVIGLYAACIGLMCVPVWFVGIKIAGAPAAQTLVPLLIAVLLIALLELVAGVGTVVLFIWYRVALGRTMRGPAQ